MDSCHFEYEPLVAALRDRGVRFLAPSDAQPGSEAIGDLELIACLTGHDQPRLRLALAALFIVHPELAPVDAHYGNLCLHALAARQPFDQLPAYNALASLIFDQLKAEAANEYATAR